MNYSVLISSMLLIYVSLFILNLLKIRSTDKLLNLITMTEKEEKGIYKRIPIGIQAPKFELIDFKGNLHNFSNLRRPLVLLIVNNNCSACSLDKWEFEKYAKTNRNLDFVLVVNSSKDLRPEDENLEVQTTNYRILKGNIDFLKKFNVKEYPTFIVINQDNRIVGYPVVTDNIDYYSKKLAFEN
ncbi:AhpC/TSA family protein [Bacillus sp. V-88]|jgi:thioredoxin-related protein|uniref:Redoxin domain-containing protein n=1 Tax=Rossellomorea vietnamensis TaxID=218284 RepID=A0A6I6URT4_9BACI|nr:redoxin domain-containing protein [Rossellomorea vietnamensis]PRX75273.1 AhpC/TSA family protein [Bacillus sp. V-88]QHE62639.1 redoxin domain-containing protein [Rossellomorea vietnamensis]SLK23724.1 AhpC/TSA family protein [Bacillus sp. V-88]